jgi:hypothetical protein
MRIAAWTLSGVTLLCVAAILVLWLVTVFSNISRGVRGRLRRLIAALVVTAVCTFIAAAVLLDFVYPAK